MSGTREAVAEAIAKAIWPRAFNAGGHESRTAAARPATDAVLALFQTSESGHFCTPACPDGCDISRERFWTRREVVARHEPMTDEEIEEVRAFIARHRGGVA